MRLIFDRFRYISVAYTLKYFFGISDIIDAGVYLIKTCAAKVRFGCPQTSWVDSEDRCNEGASPVYGGAAISEKGFSQNGGLHGCKWL